MQLASTILIFAMLFLCIDGKQMTQQTISLHSHDNEHQKLAQLEFNRIYRHMEVR